MSEKISRRNFLRTATLGAVLFSLLPDRMYDTMLRYERIGMFVLWGLVLLDVGSGALNSAIAWVFRIFCRIVGLS